MRPLAVNPNAEAKVQSQPSSLKAAIHADQEAAAAAGLPRKAQAAMVGVSYGTYCGWADAQQPDEWPSGRRLERLIDATAPGLHVVRYLAAKRGCVVVPVPTGAHASGQALAQVAREAGDVLHRGAEALDDHVLTSPELAHCDREIEEAILALLSLQAALHVQAAQAPTTPLVRQVLERERPIGSRKPMARRSA